MWIICYADDSHEMSSLIFLKKKKKRILYCYNSEKCFKDEYNSEGDHFCCPVWFNYNQLCNLLSQVFKFYNIVCHCFVLLFISDEFMNSKTLVGPPIS